MRKDDSSNEAQELLRNRRHYPRELRGGRRGRNRLPGSGRAGWSGPGSGRRHQVTAVGRGGDTPFWCGTDSNYIPIPRTAGAPYREPAIGGSYGGYIGMIGNWAAMEHCGGISGLVKADSQAARANQKTYGLGIGVGAYWFMAGPGVDPHYNGRQAEAGKWGQAQAAAR